MAENFFGITNTGRLRDNNEDTFLAETLSNGWILACVIDGVGGYEGGEVAAEIARETIRKNLQSLGADPLTAMREGFLQANQNIYNEKMRLQDKDQMACVMTIALVDMENNQFYYAHVGDTRLYLLRDNSLVKVTKDHSFVGFLEDSGRLTEKEAMGHPKRNEINKALGFDPQIDLKADYVETGSSPFLPGDMLLLCSDGLTDLVDKAGMTSILLSQSPLADRGQALIDAANVAGGKDNITVVIVHNNKKPLKIKATKPIAPKKKEDSQPVAVASAPVQPPIPKQTPAPAAKKSNAVVWMLGLLSLLLAGLCVWLWSAQDGDETLPAASTYTPNDAEKRFADSIGLASKYFLFNDTTGNQMVRLGDTVFVRQDSLHINGRGLVLSRDSAYNGAAMVVTANNQFLLLENIVFKDFATAVLLQGRGLQLKNVQFQNCAVPVQRQLSLPASIALSGFIRDSVFLKTDSLPQ